MRMPNVGNAMVASFWFVPMILVIIAVALAFGLVEVEEYVGPDRVSQWPVVLSTGPETARSILSTIATAMATVGATTFSLTIVAITLAAQQYTPKLLHNYMSNRRNQLVLGVLTGTFAYAILVLRSVRSDPGFVPTLALTIGLVLALISVGVFIYFIHHVASILQDATIAAGIESRTLATIDRAFVHDAGEAGDARCVGHGRGVAVRADKNSGYVQLIQIDQLVELMAKHDLVLTIERGAGEFVPKGGVLARIDPPDRVTQEIVEKVGSHFKIGQDRTYQQDVAYGIYQLVDIAVRALSPSFNAITTASTCIDHIGSILRQLATVELPATRHYCCDGHTRVIIESPTFGDLLTLGFHQIRTFGESYAVILIHLLEVIAELEGVIDQPERRWELVEQANRIAAAAERGLTAEVDREAINVQLEDVGTRLRDVGVVETLSLPSR